jgi:alcohol dehydrogenase (cytochrome c)
VTPEEGIKMSSTGVRRSQFIAVAASVIAVAALASTALGSRAADPPVPPGDWVSFGRTPDNARLSPMTGITPENVAQLGRAYSIDFRLRDPDIRAGNQSYPLAINGILYVTTNDANVFAIDGATGRVIWQRKPLNKAVFKNFGVAANRGLAYCDGKLFILQLNMRLVSIDPATGRVLGEVAINQDVPNASVKYGYSETSAPMCADGKLVFGAAGSERGNRGFVMAYTTDLEPAWPTPFWTIPPDGQDWRSASRIVGGGPVWTPVTIDTSTNTVFFGTGSGTPVYFPSLRPGTNPRTGSLIAVDLSTGRLKWWQQLISRNQWEYDVAQPPLVYDATIGGKKTHVVSVATKEGTWWAYDAKTGDAIHERVKVIDRVEHPPLKPGQPVTIFPGSIGGLNYSPAAYDPKTGYVLNAAAETAGVLIQKKLTPTEKKRKFLLGDVFLGLENGNFGQYLPGWKDHGSISAIDVKTGQRVWKFDTPEPERGGVTLTATGLGFAGGGDGVLRAFDVKTGKVLWSFQTGRQIAAGPTIFQGANGKQYIAITAGGTATSSGGGIASQLHVFTLGGSQQQGNRPPGLASVSRGSVGALQPLAKGADGDVRLLAAAGRRGGPLGALAEAARGQFVVSSGAVALRRWDPNSSNLVDVRGLLLLGGKPVVGARVAVDRYELPAATDASGGFTAPVDATLVRRHPLTVVDVGSATIDGKKLTDAQQAAVRASRGGITVGYRILDLKASSEGGRVVVTGRAARTDNAAPPKVVQVSFRLRGTITDSAGKPVQGASVVTRTNDRDFWTFSEPSDANGHYVAFFPASDQSGVDPVEFNVQVAFGQTNYTTAGGVNPKFKKLSAAVMDVKLPATGSVIGVPTATAEAGAFYKGLVIGVSGATGVIKPVSATWTDEKGNFRLVLPASARGQSLRFWQIDLEAFSTKAAAPGGEIDVATWPKALTGRIARDTAVIKVGA